MLFTDIKLTGNTSLHHCCYLNSLTVICRALDKVFIEVCIGPCSPPTQEADRPDEGIVEPYLTS